MPEPNRLIRQIPRDERPRERLLRHGGSALSDAELMAVLLRTGRRGVSVLEIARELLREWGSLTGLLGASLPSLRRQGLGEAKAASLLAALELGRRLARSNIPRRRPMARPAAVASYLLLRYATQDQEVMGALFLDSRNQLLSETEVFRGTMNRAAAEPRAILKEAILRGATGVLLFHTHPSGDPAPSAEDLLFTRHMAQAGEVLGIRLVDHLILGTGGRWLSLREEKAW